jgi:hypothetical protein
VLWCNRLLGINQVYYWRIFYKTHKHYNYLQCLLKQKVFTKVIKMPSLKAQMEKPMGLIKRGSRAQALYVKLQNCLIKVESVFWDWISVIITEKCHYAECGNRFAYCHSAGSHGFQIKCHSFGISLHWISLKLGPLLKTLYNCNLVRLLHQLLLAWVDLIKLF